jgi:hypothetical protein
MWAVTIEQILTRSGSALRGGTPSCGRAIEVDEKAKGGITEYGAILGRMA